jgi:hypothetical protein
MKRWIAVATLAAGVTLARTGGAEEAHQYVGAAKCKTCHAKELIGDQYETWKTKDPHHRAYETLTNEASRAIAAKRGLGSPAHEAPECLECHVTAFGVPATQVATTLDPGLGVQCESCHGPGRDYRKKKIMSDPEQAHAKGLWDAEKDAAICAKCHNERSPTFDAKRYTLSGGKTAGFDFEQAKQRIAHPIPEDVKGRYLEVEKERKGAGADEEDEE